VIEPALGDGERSLDELVRATDIPSGPAASAMTMLVLKGLVVQRPGNVFAGGYWQPVAG